MKITQKLANFVFPAPRSSGKSSESQRADLPANEANNNSATSSRCQFRFSDGRQCRNQPAQLCAHHSSTQEREGRRNGFQDEGLIGLCADLTTATNINRALSQVFLLMAQGRIPQKQAVAFGYLTQLLLQTVPGIRSEFVSVHGYRAWQENLSIRLGPSGSAANPAPTPPPGTAPSSTPVGENKEPLDEVVELDEGEYYADIYRRSLDLLDRKYDTTREGRSEAKALLLELELMKPAPAKPRRDFFGQTANLVRRLHEHESELSAPAAPPSQTPSVPRTSSAPAPQETALAEKPAASAQPSAPEPDFCSSGRPAEASRASRDGIVERQKGMAITPLLASEKDGPDAVLAPPFTAAKPNPTDNFATSPSTRPEFQSPPPRQKREEPKPPNWTEHSTDWYAPASWSGPQPDPFPSRQEKLKRKLRTMSDRRRQHQNQSRAFWQ